MKWSPESLKCQMLTVQLSLTLTDSSVDAPDAMYCVLVAESNLSALC